ncbi:hypothetical protein TNCV_4842131 [Trichonephila clavipes]|uniref:Uncharacterized protein n=1 Tax=Trichonephila clavipes TaxID=2585209 RepID=A0A8X7BMJ6_TRICX|nr:hypothetical protein TNCV_4842131 [Trichonephila clavipes]
MALFPFLTAASPEHGSSIGNGKILQGAKTRKSKRARELREISTQTKTGKIRIEVKGSLEIRSRNREAARFFNVDESNIRLWRRNKTSKIAIDVKGPIVVENLTGTELEAEINKWILKERDDGKAVSTVSIRMKARVIAREMVVQRSDRNYLMTGKNNWTTF